MDKLKRLDGSYFIQRHNLINHAEEDPIDNRYVWYPVKFDRKAIYIQVGEAIEIMKAMETTDTIVINAKTEYSRSDLPGVTPVATEEDSK